MIERGDLPFMGDLFDEPILVEVSAIDDRREALLPGERRHVARAVARRVAEFASGRASARHLMRRLGLDVSEIGVDPQRCPIWPEGVVGSIAHCDGLCIVALGPGRLVQGVGVDVEPNRPLERELWPIICTKREQFWLNDQPMEERGHLARLVFCAKEAAYKCWFPIEREFLEFSDVEVEFNSDGDRFKAEVVGAPSKGRMTERSFFGRWMIRGRWMFTGVSRRFPAIAMVA